MARAEHLIEALMLYRALHGAAKAVAARLKCTIDNPDALEMQQKAVTAARNMLHLKQGALISRIKYLFQSYTIQNICIFFCISF